MKLLLRRIFIVLSLIAVTMGALFAAYRLHPQVRKKIGDIIYIAQHPVASYDERMTWQLGDEYRLYRLALTHTPPDAVIVIAPVPDPSLRHIGRISYFLYPRRLVQPWESSSPQPTHALIVQGYGIEGGLDGQSAAALDEHTWGIVDLRSGDVFTLEGGPSK